MGPGRQIARVLIGGLIIVVLGFCGLVGYRVINFATSLMTTTDPLSNPRVVALLRLPEYQLAYPGAVLLEHSVSPPANPSFFGRGTPAIASETYGIPAPVPAQVDDQAVVDWYARQLQARGWILTQIPNNGNFSAQSYWLKRPYSAQIGVYNLPFLHTYDPSIDTTKYPIVFQLLFLG
jgi:hypothetical protein